MTRNTLSGFGLLLVSLILLACAMADKYMPGIWVIPFLVGWSVGWGGGGGWGEALAFVNFNHGNVSLICLVCDRLQQEGR